MPTHKTYRLRGMSGEASAPATSEIAVTQSRSLRPGIGREAVLGEVDVLGDEVVRIELENGFVLWSRADDLIRERGKKSVGRDGSEAWEIDPRPPERSGIQRGSRGWLGLGIRVLEFFGVNLSGKTAGALGSKLEEKQLGGNPPGLYRCDLGDQFQLTPAPDGEIAQSGDHPLLIFIHGTGSSCQGSFGKLWEPGSSARDAARTSLKQLYGDRAFAWEHRSLTQSPIPNALELVKRLPPNAKLHLVTHSRGGLVGELLCLAQRAKQEDPLKSAELTSTLFNTDRTLAEQLGLNPLDPDASKERDKAYQTDRDDLNTLVQLLDERQLQVQRFVRVACPTRGTTLASGRLDRWLSVLNYLMGGGLAGDVADFLLAVVKERTDPRTLPGLEAMMPGSALTRLLHHPALVTESDLSVISGDIEGDSLWGQIKLLATDWFYGADHDLVVNTGSMYGGLRRTDNKARFLKDQGPTVNHFSYFENDKSVRWLMNGLSRTENTDGGFQPLKKARQEEPRWREAVRRSRGVTTPRPLAVMLPGTLGSSLQVQNDRVWLHYRRLLLGGLERLEIDATDVQATDLLDKFYGPLLEFLARSHRVEIFPYDWRLSVRDAANQLADKLELWLPEFERTKQPVHLIAHSMGGLVVRAMISGSERGAALWRRIIQLPSSRLLMLGTPNLGSYEAVRWLTGRNPTEIKLSLLDLTRTTDGIIDIVRHFPGLLELLPFDEDSPDFSQQTRWKELKHELFARWEPAEAPVLTQAKATWDLLNGAEPDTHHMIYVAGCQNATVIDYRLEEYEESHLVGRKYLEFIATREGDGTVSWKSGFMPGVPVWYVEDTAHDELCQQKRAFPGYQELLMTGTTARLPDKPPDGTRARAGESRQFTLPPLPPTDDIPDEESLSRSGFGISRPFESADTQRGLPIIQLSLRHGDLAYAQHPILVGHYLGDTIVSAEQKLDKALAGALSRRLQLGLYPGPIGTHALFFHDNAGHKPEGAVVIGLGQVGQITPGLLSTGVRDALLEYALRIAQWPDERFGPVGSPRAARITALLVGSGAGGMAVGDSIRAILRGVVDANARLVDAELDNQVLIDRLEFLDMYEDVAIAAADALETVLKDGELAAEISWPDGIIAEGQGGQRRLRRDEAPDWWHRLEIIQDNHLDKLRFIAVTERARAEETLAVGQLRLAESFIQQACKSPAINTEVAKTLFEMLLPNRLKQLAPREVDLVLLVDNASAAYPWELLQDRWSQSGRPPAIAAGLVRQLKTPSFRPLTLHATEPTALVIGNPDLAGWKVFPDLPGARQEAQKVATVLSSKGYKTQTCIDEQAHAILSSLHQQAWRILHLAGHGEHEFPLEFHPATPSTVLAEEFTDAPATGGTGYLGGANRPLKLVSGMVIGEDTFLTPGDVEQMRWVPELVFINCCHLGKTEAAGVGRYNLLAANLAVQFIKMGVKAVVAAGWAVDDAAAETFAESFYTHLLEGEPFGRAVRAAREEIWKRFPTVNTWGAYQCYGDPSYRLHGDGTNATTPKKASYHTPAELIAKLRNDTEWVRVQIREKHESPEDLDAFRSMINDHLKGVPASHRKAWLERADVAAALGFAWGEIGDYAAAVQWLQTALQAKLGDCPLRAVEQCANFQVRLAGQQLREATGKGMKEDQRQRLIETIHQAIDELDGIAARAPTTERLSIMGSACKRLAWLHTDSNFRMEALINMANYYRKAFELSKKADPNPYLFTNWGTAKLLASRLDPDQGGEWQSTLSAECQAMIQSARERNEKSPNFWDGVAEGDCRLVLLLNEPPVTREAANQTATSIIEAYRTASQRGASPREYASVREHLEFVIAMTLAAADSHVGHALHSIYSAL